MAQFRLVFHTGLVFDANGLPYCQILRTSIKEVVVTLMAMKMMTQVTALTRNLSLLTMNREIYDPNEVDDHNADKRGSE